MQRFPWHSGPAAFGVDQDRNIDLFRDEIAAMIVALAGGVGGAKLARVGPDRRPRLVGDRIPAMTGIGPHTRT